jgi:hypothetical protein
MQRVKATIAVFYYSGFFPFLQDLSFHDSKNCIDALDKTFSPFFPPGHETLRIPFVEF